MFGLTKREQRWKAEQQAAEVLAGLAAVAIRGVTDARIAEAKVDADELARLRAEVAEWEKLRDPVTLHANLLRGIPCRLDRDTFLHLAGDETPNAVVVPYGELIEYPMEHGAFGSSTEDKG